MRFPILALLILSVSSLTSCKNAEEKKPAAPRTRSERLQDLISGDVVLTQIGRDYVISLSNCEKLDNHELDFTQVLNMYSWALYNMTTAEERKYYFGIEVQMQRTGEDKMVYNAHKDELDSIANDRKYLHQLARIIDHRDFKALTSFSGTFRDDGMEMSTLRRKLVEASEHLGRLQYDSLDFFQRREVSGGKKFETFMVLQGTFVGDKGKLRAKLLFHLYLSEVSRDYIYRPAAFSFEPID